MTSPDPASLWILSENEEYESENENEMDPTSILLAEIKELRNKNYFS